MREFQERKRTKKFFYSTKFIIVLFLFFSFLFYSDIKIFIKSHSASLKKEETKKELESAQERKNELKKELNRLNTAAGEEDEIRKNLNVVKPGEHLLIIVEKTQEDGNINDNSGVGGFFKDVYNWIKDKI
jgi:cell division protein FtsB